MSVAILGCGWATPLGGEIDSVVDRIRNADRATPEISPARDGATSRAYFPVPDAVISEATRIPRLRRSSRISHLAMSAAVAAVRDANPDGVIDGERTALVFAASDGGVIYTRRFFTDIAARGAGSGSPLLFPETVYNAPASHVAAQFQISGTTTTVVGDSPVAIHALAMAEDLLDSNECDRCVVVAAEEWDWVLSEAYAAWRIGRGTALFGELGSALILGRDGDCRVELSLGANFGRVENSQSALLEAIRALTNHHPFGGLVGSMAGTKFDRFELAAVAESGFVGENFHPRLSLGEAFGASSLAQIIMAARLSARGLVDGAVLVPCLGWNGQCAAAGVWCE